MNVRREHPTERELEVVKEHSLAEGINDVGVSVVTQVGIRCSSALRTLSKKPCDLEDNRLTNATHNHTAASIALDEASIRFEEQNDLFGVCEDNLFAAIQKRDALKEKLRHMQHPEPTEDLTPQIEQLQLSLDNCEIQGVTLYNIKAQEESSLKAAEADIINTMTETEAEIVSLSKSIEEMAELQMSNRTHQQNLWAAVEQLREKLKDVEGTHDEALQKLSSAQREHQISRQRHAEIIISCEASLDEALGHQLIVDPGRVPSSSVLTVSGVATEQQNTTDLVGGGMLSPIFPSTGIEDIVREKCSPGSAAVDVSPAVGRITRNCLPPCGRSSLPPPRLPSVMTEEGRSYSRLPSTSRSISVAEVDRVWHPPPSIPSQQPPLISPQQVAVNRNGMLSPPLLTRHETN